MKPQSKALLVRAVENLDVTLALAGCILAIPITLYLQLAIPRTVYTPVSIILFISCLAYLLLRRLRQASTQTQAEAMPRLYLLLNTLFFCALTYSIAILHLRSDPYTRPVSYLVALAAMAAIIAIEIFFLPPRKGAADFVLCKIIIIVVSTAWSQLLIYPGVVGVDPWVHQMFTLRLIDGASIPEGSLYSNLPAMHLVIGGTSLITALDYKTATMLSVSLVQIICNTLFVFLLGRVVHSVKAGLLAALFLGFVSLHIRWAFWTIPNGMGVAFIPVILYLLYKVKRDNPRVSLALAALLVAALLLTHTIAAAMLVMLLFLLWLSFELHWRLRYQRGQRESILLPTSLLLAGVGLTSWALGSEHIIRDLVKIAGRIRTELVAFFVPGAGPSPVDPSQLQLAVAQYSNSIPLAETVVLQLGFVLFFTFALIGACAMLSHSMRNRYGFALVTSSLMILAISFFVVLRFRSDLTGRFNYLVQMLLAIPVGIASLWLASLPRRRLASALLLGTVVLVSSFLMMMSPNANMDNRTLSPNTVVRFAFTQSELAAMKTVSAIHDGDVAADRYVAHLSDKIRRELHDSSLIGLSVLPRIAVDMGDELYSGEFHTLNGTLVLIRDEVIHHPFQIGPEGILRLTYDPRKSLTEQLFSKVYDCGSVSGFVNSQ